MVEAQSCYGAASPLQLLEIFSESKEPWILPSIEILQENVMPSVRKLMLGRRWTFQQDNYPKRTSKSTKAWFQQKSWSILDWPSQSPDLNPIENLWWDLKKAVAACKPVNLSQLEAFAIEAWAKIPTACCQKLVSWYAKHLREVIKAKGCCTKY